MKKEIVLSIIIVICFIIMAISINPFFWSENLLTIINYGNWFFGSFGFGCVSIIAYLIIKIKQTK